MRIIVGLLLGWGLTIGSLPALRAQDASVRAGWSFATLSATPILNGGRLKPFDSFARETLLFETGKRSYSGWNPVNLLLSWISSPDRWDTEEIILVSRQDVRRQLGLDDKRTLWSPRTLFSNTSLNQYLQELSHTTEVAGAVTPPGGPKTPPREQEIRTLTDRLNLFHGLISGNAWTLCPTTYPEPWKSLLDTSPAGEPIRQNFVRLLQAYQGAREADFAAASRDLRSSIEAQIGDFGSAERRRVELEVLYNRTRPFLWAWSLYLVAALGLFCVLDCRPQTVLRTWIGRSAQLSLSLAVVAHALGIAARCVIAGRPPVTNMYESVIWVGAGVSGMALILYAFYRQRILLCTASVLAALALIAGDAAPAVLDPALHPLVPVLRSNYWLTVHVLTITLGYAAFGLTFGLANVTLFRTLRRRPVAEIQSLNQLSYRATQFGVVLIAAGTLLGGIWADYSWGRFWGWDPKEVWALITLLAYVIILHGRYTSWVTTFSFAVYSSLAFMTVIMAWYGVNFILGVGLHSYGFASGGAPFVAAFVIAELSYVLGVSWVHWRRSLVLVPANP